MGFSLVVDEEGDEEGEEEDICINDEDCLVIACV